MAKQGFETNLVGAVVTPNPKYRFIGIGISTSEMGFFFKQFMDTGQPAQIRGAYLSAERHPILMAQLSTGELGKLYPEWVIIEGCRNEDKG